MTTTTFDERKLKEQLFAQNAIDFYNFVTKYDEQMVPVMRLKVTPVFIQWSAR